MLVVAASHSLTIRRKKPWKRAVWDPCSQGASSDGVSFVLVDEHRVAELSEDGTAPRKNAVTRRMGHRLRLISHQSSGGYVAGVQSSGGMFVWNRHSGTVHIVAATPLLPSLIEEAIRWLDSGSGGDGGVGLSQYLPSSLLRLRKSRQAQLAATAMIRSIDVSADGCLVAVTTQEGNLWIWTALQSAAEHGQWHCVEPLQRPLPSQPAAAAPIAKVQRVVFMRDERVGQAVLMVSVGLYRFQEAACNAIAAYGDHGAAPCASCGGVYTVPHGSGSRSSVVSPARGDDCPAGMNDDSGGVDGAEEEEEIAALCTFTLALPKDEQRKGEGPSCRYAQASFLIPVGLSEEHLYTPPPSAKTTCPTMLLDLSSSDPPPDCPSPPCLPVVALAINASVPTKAQLLLVHIPGLIMGLASLARGRRLGSTGQPCGGHCPLCEGLGDGVRGAVTPPWVPVATRVQLAKVFLQEVPSTAAVAAGGQPAVGLAAVDMVAGVAWESGGRFLAVAFRSGLVGFISAVGGGLLATFHPLAGSSLQSEPILSPFWAFFAPPFAPPTPPASQPHRDKYPPLHSIGFHPSAPLMLRSDGFSVCSFSLTLLPSTSPTIPRPPHEGLTHVLQRVWEEVVHPCTAKYDGAVRPKGVLAAGEDGEGRQGLALEGVSAYLGRVGEVDSLLALEMVWWICRWMTLAVSLDPGHVLAGVRQLLRWALKRQKASDQHTGACVGACLLEVLVAHRLALESPCSDSAALSTGLPSLDLPLATGSSCPAGKIARLRSQASLAGLRLEIPILPLAPHSMPRPQPRPATPTHARCATASLMRLLEPVEAPERDHEADKQEATARAGENAAVLVREALADVKVVCEVLQLGLGPADRARRAKREGATVTHMGPHVVVEPHYPNAHAERAGDDHKGQDRRSETRHNDWRKSKARVGLTWLLEAGTVLSHFIEGAPTTPREGAIEARTIARRVVETHARHKDDTLPASLSQPAEKAWLTVMAALVASNAAEVASAILSMLCDRSLSSPLSRWEVVTLVAATVLHMALHHQQGDQTNQDKDPCASKTPSSAPLPSSAASIAIVWTLDLTRAVQQWLQDPPPTPPAFESMGRLADTESVKLGRDLTTPAVGLLAVAGRRKRRREEGPRSTDWEEGHIPDMARPLHDDVVESTAESPSQPRMASSSTVAAMLLDRSAHEAMSPAIPQQQQQQPPPTAFVSERDAMHLEELLLFVSLCGCLVSGQPVLALLLTCMGRGEAADSKQTHKEGVLTVPAAVVETLVAALEGRAGADIKCQVGEALVDAVTGCACTLIQRIDCRDAGKTSMSPLRVLTSVATAALRDKEGGPNVRISCRFIREALFRYCYAIDRYGSVLWLGHTASLLHDMRRTHMWHRGMEPQEDPYKSAVVERIPKPLVGVGTVELARLVLASLRLHVEAALSSTLFNEDSMPLPVPFVNRLRHLLTDEADIDAVAPRLLGYVPRCGLWRVATTWDTVLPTMMMQRDDGGAIETSALLGKIAVPLQPSGEPFSSPPSWTPVDIAPLGHGTSSAPSDPPPLPAELLTFETSQLQTMAQLEDHLCAALGLLDIYRNVRAGLQEKTATGAADAKEAAALESVAEGLQHRIGRGVWLLVVRDKLLKALLRKELAQSVAWACRLLDFDDVYPSRRLHEVLIALLEAIAAATPPLQHRRVVTLKGAWLIVRSVERYLSDEQTEGRPPRIPTSMKARLSSVAQRLSDSGMVPTLKARIPAPKSPTTVAPKSAEGHQRHHPSSAVASDPVYQHVIGRLFTRCTNHVCRNYQRAKARAFQHLKHLHAHFREVEKLHLTKTAKGLQPHARESSLSTISEAYVEQPTGQWGWDDRPLPYLPGRADDALDVVVDPDAYPSFSSFLAALQTPFSVIQKQAAAKDTEDKLDAFVNAPIEGPMTARRAREAIEPLSLPPIHRPHPAPRSPSFLGTCKVPDCAPDHRHTFTRLSGDPHDSYVRNADAHPHDQPPMAAQRQENDDDESSEDGEEQGSGETDNHAFSALLEPSSTTPGLRAGEADQGGNEVERVAEAVLVDHDTQGEGGGSVAVTSSSSVGGWHDIRGRLRMQRMKRMRGRGVSHSRDLLPRVVSTVGAMSTGLTPPRRIREGVQKLVRKIGRAPGTRLKAKSPRASQYLPSLTPTSVVPCAPDATPTPGGLPTAIVTPPPQPVEPQGAALKQRTISTEAAMLVTSETGTTAQDTPSESDRRADNECSPCVEHEALQQADIDAGIELSLQCSGYLDTPSNESLVQDPPPHEADASAARVLAALNDALESSGRRVRPPPDREVDHRSPRLFVTHPDTLHGSSRWGEMDLRLEDFDSHDDDDDVQGVDLDPHEDQGDDHGAEEEPVMGQGVTPSQLPEPAAAEMEDISEVQVAEEAPDHPDDGAALQQALDGTLHDHPLPPEHDDETAALQHTEVAAPTPPPPAEVEGAELVDDTIPDADKDEGAMAVVDEPHVPDDLDRGRADTRRHEPFPLTPIIYPDEDKPTPASRDAPSPLNTAAHHPDHHKHAFSTAARRAHEARPVADTSDSESYDNRPSSRPCHRCPLSGGGRYRSGFLTEERTRTRVPLTGVTGVTARYCLLDRLPEVLEQSQGIVEHARNLPPLPRRRPHRVKKRCDFDPFFRTGIMETSFPSMRATFGMRTAPPSADLPPPHIDPFVFVPPPQPPDVGEPSEPPGGVDVRTRTVTDAAVSPQTAPVKRPPERRDTSVDAMEAAQTHDKATQHDPADARPQPAATDDSMDLVGARLTTIESSVRRLEETLEIMRKRPPWGRDAGAGDGQGGRGEMGTGGAGGLNIDVAAVSARQQPSSRFPSPMISLRERYKFICSELPAGGAEPPPPQPPPPPIVEPQHTLLLYPDEFLKTRIRSPPRSLSPRQSQPSSRSPSTKARGGRRAGAAPAPAPASSVASTREGRFQAIRPITSSGGKRAGEVSFRSAALRPSSAGARRRPTSNGPSGRSNHRGRAAAQGRGQGRGRCRGRGAGRGRGRAIPTFKAMGTRFGEALELLENIIDKNRPYSEEAKER
ncbi:unnamed protein product [Vitrella brassicaformis CCMP3155]|uniref:Uncharacterized protein n=2 Tax=Vitrella brassicaformis TaxID=1169539 RepID=A0A0G4FDN9_VITBC|nr:unnamed protein product [Vitrella brassicaformis CCMP3155]|eukprot:CEM11303.1 unnamed protein product [Vitrella brassicaformis CCMP3155]